MSSFSTPFSNISPATVKNIHTHTLSAQGSGMKNSARVLKLKSFFKSGQNNNSA
jgi:hypothetical protein